MKHLYIIFLALLACCPEVIHAENEISYLAEIGIQNRVVVKKGREVQLTMLVDLSELKIRDTAYDSLDSHIAIQGWKP